MKISQQKPLQAIFRVTTGGDTRSTVSMYDIMKRAYERIREEVPELFQFLHFTVAEHDHVFDMNYSSIECTLDVQKLEQVAVYKQFLMMTLIQEARDAGVHMHIEQMRFPTNEDSMHQQSLQIVFATQPAYLF